jgi:signal transduction histidine kinase
MAARRNRASSNDGTPDPTAGPAFFSQARRAAGSLVDNVQQRLPADVARQLRTGQRTVERNLKRLQQQMRRSATQADVDRLTQRIDELSRDVEELLAQSRRESRSSTGRGSSGSAPARASRPRTSRSARKPADPGPGAEGTGGSETG